MNLKRAMNDDTGEFAEKVNGNKIRKQSESNPIESEDTNKVESNADRYKSNGGCCINPEPGSSTSFNNLNGGGSSMNNLNSHSISSGYSSKFGDGNRDYRNGVYGSKYRQFYASSSSEDDDEHCVYTYKGADVGSDLPESFLCLGMNVTNGGARNSCSSPDMDYLEMDFDPGPSNGQDSDSDNNISYIGGSLSNERVAAELLAASSIDSVQPSRDIFLSCDENANCFSKQSSFVPNNEVVASSSINVDLEKPCCSKSLAVQDAELMNNDVANVTINSYNSDDCVDFSSEDEIPCDRLSVADVDFRPRIVAEDSDTEENIFIPDAFRKGVCENQNSIFADDTFDISLVDSSLEDSLECYDDLLPIDPSYSISAIVNVIKLLRISDCIPIDREAPVDLVLGLRKQIPKNVPLVEYLFMRAVQNANENDLSNFSSNVFQKKLHSRFFSTYPRTNINLLEWLNIWMIRGAVPVVTRNIQERGTLSARGINRNPWKHSVVYKLESSYLYLSNPSEKISESLLQSQLSQAPLIFIKRTSILKRWNSKVDLTALMRANHNRWYDENVLGQVATIIRENGNCSEKTPYVRIPSSCNCGITLFVPSENSALCREVDEASELPFVR